MLEVYTWEPNANSGKPLLCLEEKAVPFVYHYIGMGQREQFKIPLPERPRGWTASPRAGRFVGRWVRTVSARP
jgi:hypothetical protein